MSKPTTMNMSTCNINAADKLHQSLELRDPGKKGKKNTTTSSPAFPILALSLLTLSSPPGSPYWTPDYSPKPSPKLTPKESPVLSFAEGDLENSSGISQPSPSEASDDSSQYLPTSCPAIDTALHGGFTYNLINSLSSGYSTERTLIAMHAVISHLFSHADAKAVWVDTEGTFSASKLKTVVASRVDGLEMAVEAVLDRVQVARVFDMQGLLEVLGELKEGHEGWGGEWKVEGESKVKNLGEMSERIINDSQDDSGEEERSEGEAKEEVINDSQEDEENWEDGEGEEDGRRQGGKEGGEDDTGMGVVVVVDTITHLLSEMKFIDQGKPKDLEKGPFEAEDNWHEMDKPEATALFVDFCHSFSLVAKSRKTCLLFLNDTTSTPDDEDPYVRSHELFPSQFHAFSKAKPSLGPVYTEYMDLSVLLTKQPRDLNYVGPNFVIPESIKPLDGSAKPEGRMTIIRGNGYREDWVVEVVGDRYGDRVGRWGAFDVEGVELVDILWDDGED